MRGPSALWLRGLCALVVLLGVSATRADGLSGADAQALRGYSLSADKIHRYGVASKTWTQAQKTDPQVRAEAQNKGEAQTSLADLRAKMTRRPQTFSYFKAQGLSQDDVILIPLTCMYASVAAMFRDPHKVPADITEAVSPAQVRFVRQHRAEIQAAGIFISN